MRNLKSQGGLMACLLLSALVAEASAQSGGFGNAPSSPYRQGRIGSSTGRTFGSEVRSPGSSAGSRFGTRLPGPTLGNRPTRNNSPVLSPALNLIPGAVDNFTGQYLLRTVPFERANQQGQDQQRAVVNLQDDVNRLRTPVTGDRPAAIRSGLTTTGHNAAFLNTGSYFPSRNR